MKIINKLYEVVIAASSTMLKLHTMSERELWAFYVFWISYWI